MKVGRVVLFQWPNGAVGVGVVEQFEHHRNLTALDLVSGKRVKLAYEPRQAHKMSDGHAEEFARNLAAVLLVTSGSPKVFEDLTTTKVSTSSFKPTHALARASEADEVAKPVADAIATEYVAPTETVVTLSPVVIEAIKKAVRQAVSKKHVKSVQSVQVIKPVKMVKDSKVRRRVSSLKPINRIKGRTGQKQLAANVAANV